MVVAAEELTYTRQIARHVATAELVQYPEQIRELGKQLVLDTLGNAIGGAVTDAGRLILEYADESMGGAPEASVISRMGKVSAKDAAFVNAQLAALLDMDETYRSAGHPGAPIVMTALAAGERAGASGKRVLTAVLTAYDVTTRLIDAVNPTMSGWMRGVYPFACTDAFGPAIAAAIVFGLDEGQTYHTLGIGGGNARIAIAGKQLEPPMPLMKCSQGWHSEHGIIAALLAKKGFTGIHEILDGDKAFWAAAASDRWMPEKLMDGLGERCNITNMSLKAQPMCRWIHTAVEATADLVKVHDLRADEIDEVRVWSHGVCTRGVYRDQRPKDMVSAQFSMPFGIAMVLLGVPAGPKWYRSDVYDDPRMQRIADKVTVLHDDSGEADACHSKDPGHILAKVAIIARGQTFTNRRDWAKGDPQNPFTRDDVEDKFRILVEGQLASERAERVVATVRRLESTPEVGELMSLLRA